jgi:hypothetical protein
MDLQLAHHILPAHKQTGLLRAERVPGHVGVGQTGGRNSTSPSSGNRPISAASSVVFPAPLAPITVAIEPWATLSETSDTASTRP